MGDCPARYLADTITLTVNITLSEPLPAITSDITIEGKDHTIDGAKRFRIFDVDGGQLRLNQLTLRNGSAQGENGGAIRLRNGAVLNVSEVNFSGNSAENGAAIGADDSVLNIDRSQFLGNHAADRGAGVFINGGLHSLDNVTGRGNTAPGAKVYRGGSLSWYAAVDSGVPSFGYIFDSRFD